MKNVAFGVDSADAYAAATALGIDAVMTGSPRGMRIEKQSQWQNKRRRDELRGRRVAYSSAGHWQQALLYGILTPCLQSTRLLLIPGVAPEGAALSRVFQ
ncbi:hypothetical protein [Burkholderia sp. S171]|uniref:hypothetical protein n=1 Tax=Burkholderia sp. S171 TaxID=1641860 RepID=UPI001C2079B1|nr:hypothetical protein [Burkholderia sp. S171]